MQSISVIALLGASLLMTGLPSSFAYTYSLQDVYVDAKTPTKIPWYMTSISEDYSETFYCDKSPQTTFKLGKTTVRCVETKYGGDIRSSFVVTVGYNIVQVPEWFKTPTKFWLDGLISDKEYFSSLKTMIQNGYISIPQATVQNESGTIPVWIYQTSEKWINNSITDDEFSIALQWLIQNGFIV